MLRFQFAGSCAGGRGLVVGLCARQRTHFSCFAKKSKQKKASRIRRPCGHAALLSFGGVRANSLRSNMRAP